MRVNFADAGPPDPDPVLTSGLRVVETVEYESESRPDMIHTARRWSNGAITCTCEGWKYRKQCKHTLALWGFEGNLTAAKEYRRTNDVE